MAKHKTYRDAFCLELSNRVHLREKRQKELVFEYQKPNSLILLRKMKLLVNVIQYYCVTFGFLKSKNDILNAHLLLFLWNCPLQTLGKLQGALPNTVKVSVLILLTRCNFRVDFVLTS